MKPVITAGFALAALTLAACDDNGERMVNAKICASFTAPAQAGAVAAVADPASPVDGCVKRWAYSLAGARDTADVVAGAAVAACGAAISQWNQGGVDQGVPYSTGQYGPSPAQPTGGDSQAISLETGLPTNAMAEHSAFAHRRALLYVVEARAGRCKPPPAKDGAPVGA